MSRGKCDIRIGTSGWHYDHWKERFYPAGLAKSKWLEHYARYFNTVEINNTFYQLPKEGTFDRWREQGPAGFVFTVKANRFITHIKKLAGVEEGVEHFITRVRLLGEKLGPVLYQLPPNLHVDVDRLRMFLKLLPADIQAVFEFRHDSWYCDEVFGLLDEHGCSFCVHDLDGLETPRLVMGKVVYVRFHGTTGRYAGSYTKAMLREWADWMKGYAGRVKCIYAYFNNDVEGYAVRNAMTLKELL
ncbi:DUF72 domain-containing protein [Candidatus Pacearchaeota archaeon]|nr:DUF72 domain-containing protein [Candidatus Pacearchaeota archaeon]